MQGHKFLIEKLKTVIAQKYAESKEIMARKKVLPNQSATIFGKNPVGELKLPTKSPFRGI